jgi:hypothetical protein
MRLSSVQATAMACPAANAQSMARLGKSVMGSSGALLPQFRAAEQSLE